MNLTKTLAAQGVKIVTIDYDSKTQIYSLPQFMIDEGWTIDQEQSKKYKAPALISPEKDSSTTPLMINQKCVIIKDGSISVVGRSYISI
jgi:hypothetical protein